METTTTQQKREIANLGVLDLTGMQTPDNLAAIQSIVNVGIILVPQSLASKLLSIPMANVGAIVPVPDGEKVKAHTHLGATQISGEALSVQGDEYKHALVVLGALTITTPVETIGFDQIIVMGPIFAPRGSEGALSRALTTVHGPLHYYPNSDQTKFYVGDLQISGAALASANNKPGMTLVVTGNLFITSTVEKLGYQQIYVIGNVFAPKESEILLSARLEATGSTLWYNSTPRFFNGIEAFSAEFLELLPHPIAMILNGNFEFTANVTIALLRSKVTEIVLNGIIDAPKALVPFLQVLTTQKTGMINASDDGETDENSDVG